MYCFFNELAALLDVPTFRLVASSLHFLFLFTCNQSFRIKSLDHIDRPEQLVYSRCKQDWLPELNEKPPDHLLLSCAHLCKTTNILNTHVETEQIQWFATNSWQVGHAHGFFFDKGKVAVHPHLPFWFGA